VRQAPLVPVPMLTGSCTAREAVAVATALAGELEPGSQAWRVGSVDGCDAEGRSIRWEVRFDLERRRAEAVVTVAFVYEESTRTHGEGVASVALVGFPAEGSELAKMGATGEISARGLRAVWRQQMRERPALPPDFPDSSVITAKVAPDEVRSAYARITRQRGFVWVVETPGRTRHLRFDDLPK
jgi:hypothetical protein